MKAILWVLIAVWALLPSLAAAQDAFEKALQQARQGLEARDPAATMKALNQAAAEAFKRLPFKALNVHLVAAPPSGFGRYLPRVDNVYRPGEPLILYMEPVGFKVIENQKNGLYRFSLTADFNLVDAWGMVVSGRRSVGRFGGESRQFPDRYPLTFTYNLAGLPAGEYRFETILRDLLGKRSHTVVTPIHIQGP
ncbi:MAG: hypothetical protein PVG03_01315 [Desulfarculaceae bacterium]|jgi:hypothetical protein